MGGTHFESMQYATHLQYITAYPGAYGEAPPMTFPETSQAKNLLVCSTSASGRTSRHAGVVPRLPAARRRDRRGSHPRCHGTSGSSDHPTALDAHLLASRH